MALNKSEVIRFVRHLQSDVSAKLCLGFGGVLVLNGLRKTTNDIDISVDQRTFNELSFTHDVDIVYVDDVKTKIIHYSDIVDIHLPMNDEEVEWNKDYRVYCLSLNCILKKKLEWNRPKDQADIVALKNHLGLV